MEKKGYRFTVVNRDSEMINQLLDFYHIQHIVRNPRPNKKGTFASLLNLAKMIGYCIKASLKFKPDIYLGFGSSACAITSFLFRKPCILIDDTEHNAMNHRLYKPFCSVVLTPFYFKKNLGKKQLRFNAYVEQLYLHSRYFSPNTEVLSELGLKPGEYALIRYITYDAHHDLATQPLPEDYKKTVAISLSKKLRVVLSHENKNCDKDYLPFMLKFSPEKIHDVEAGTKFVISEGATMASEAFVLGVPYVYINPLRVGNVDYQTENYPQRAQQGFTPNDVDNAIERIAQSAIDSDTARRNLEQHTIDPTAMLVWFVEKYPDSVQMMRENPNNIYWSAP